MEVNTPWGTAETTSASYKLGRNHGLSVGAITGGVNPMPITKNVFNITPCCLVDSEALVSTEYNIPVTYIYPWDYVKKLDWQNALVDMINKTGFNCEASEWQSGTYKIVGIKIPICNNQRYIHIGLLNDTSYQTNETKDYVPRYYLKYQLRDASGNLIKDYIQASYSLQVVNSNLQFYSSTVAHGKIKLFHFKPNTSSEIFRLLDIDQLFSLSNGSYLDLDGAAVTLSNPTLICGPINDTNYVTNKVISFVSPDVEYAENIKLYHTTFNNGTILEDVYVPLMSLYGKSNPFILVDVNTFEYYYCVHFNGGIGSTIGINSFKVLGKSDIKYSFG